MGKKKVSVVITDLDNTLFDWFDMWHSSFVAMLSQLETDSGIPRAELIPAIKRVHQQHGTSEYAFLIEELEPLRAKHPKADLANIYQGAIDAWQAARNDHLKLYPGVLASLETLKENGCLIVAYTESMGFYTNERLKKLGLDGVIDILYSPEDHSSSATLTAQQAARYPAEQRRLQFTEHRHTPKGEVKPNEDILLSIVSDVGASLEQAVYVGDDLVKDVSMAQKARVLDVWAKYGTVHQLDAYDLLKSVTHWTDEQVRTQKETTPIAVKPTYVLESGFAEILTLFDFIRFNDNAQRDNVRKPENVIEIWKKIVDVQMHFNDLELRVRNFAITVIGAFLGLFALVVDQQISVPVFGRRVSGAVLPLMAAGVAVINFYMMDRLWYHRLLRAAVTQGHQVEDSLSAVYPEIALARAISAGSPIRNIHSNQKIDLFYGFFGLVIVGLLIAFYLVAPEVPVAPETASGPVPVYPP